MSKERTPGKGKALLVATLLMACGTVCAQQEEQQQKESPPAGGTPRDFTLPQQETEQLENGLQHFMERTGRRLQEAVRALHIVSPLATLERGYAIVSHGPDNSIVRDADDLQEGETINTRLAKGRVAARVSRITREES